MNHSKVAGYKVSTKNKITFLSIGNEQAEPEIKNKIPFALARTKMKHLGINITIYEQDLHEENYKALTKEIKEALNKQRDISGS